jgi:hypothetical protein
MKQVKIEVSINVKSRHQVEALNSFLTAIGDDMDLDVASREIDTHSPLTETPEVEDEPKIEDIRTLIGKKIQGHRTEIKSKLTALGANNVTSLEEGKYQEFIDFLKELK